MGMQYVSIPPTVTLKTGCSGYGIMHYSGVGDQRPDDKIKKQIEGYIEILIASV